jgi:hypothetical protein
VAVLPDKPTGKIFSAERRKEIADCLNERVRLEKRSVWKLLEYALETTFGKKSNGFVFAPSQNGKWRTDGVEFSLSHSGNALCVALSSAPVGIDVEKIALPKSGKLLEKIFSEREREEYSALEQDQARADYFTQKWTRKESAFKSLDLPAFLPALPRLEKIPTQALPIELAGEKYFLSVAGEHALTINLRSAIQFVTLL